MNLETDGKISLIVTFMQWCVTQSKLSLSFTKALSFPHKKACFCNNSHNAYKNGDCNPKFNVTKLNPWKLTFWKQPVIAKDEIKVSIILTNKSDVKANTSTISFFALVSFFFEDVFKASKEEKNLNEI